METPSLFDSLNLIKQCRKYNLSLWQCPQFLFLVLGLVVISSSLAIYFIGVEYSENPEIVAVIVLGVAAFLLVVGFLITQSFERLAELARLKTEFIGIISHQLRSPLANLSWVIDLLISGRLKPVEEKELSYLQILRENSSRMEELVGDLLVVSRMESGAFAFKKKETDLVNLVQKTIERFLPLASASNVQINFHPAANLPPAFLDPSHLGQVVENLLDNAIRYIKDKGRVEVNLSARAKDFYLEVKDNGPGIPEDDQKFIFQKFFRGENAFRQQTQGSGLGLYIAKLIVEKSGGKIGFVSRVNEGSTFWFTLPIK